MKTPDLRVLRDQIARNSNQYSTVLTGVPNPKDAMKIVLKAQTKFQRHPEADIETRVFVMWPGHSHKFKELYATKSLRYRNHSTYFGWGHAGLSARQFALAICIELYGVSQGMEVYDTFCTKYIAQLPDGDFTKEMIVEL